MPTDDPVAKYHRQMSALFDRYLAHCKKTGVHPASRKYFEAQVQIRIARMAAQKIIDNSPAEDQDKAIYITTRKIDREKDLYVPGSVERQCMQCGYAVLVDPHMLDIADKAAGILCEHCVPEITGKTMTQVAIDELKNL